VPKDLNIDASIDQTAITQPLPATLDLLEQVRAEAHSKRKPKPRSH
jgi:hypothetical protein